MIVDKLKEKLMDAKSHHRKLTMNELQEAFTETLHKLETSGFDILRNRHTDFAAEMLTATEMDGLDIDTFNHDCTALIDMAKHYRYDMRFVDQIMPWPEDAEWKGPEVYIPVEHRPLLVNDDVKGRIGKIYMRDSGMRNYLPYCDIYSEQYPDELIADGVNLCYNNFPVSQVLEALQAVLDPEHSDSEWSKVIKRCHDFEGTGGDPLFNLLEKYGLAVVNLNLFDAGSVFCYEPYGDMNTIFVDCSTKKVWGMVLADEDLQYYKVPIEPIIQIFDSIVFEIQNAINTAKRRYPNGL